MQPLSHRPTRRRLRLGAAMLIATAVATACADDTPGLTDLGAGSSVPSDSVPSDSIPSDSVPGTERPCEPVNADLEASATSTVNIVVLDYAFDEAEYTVDAGVITFRVVNEGPAPHEVAFLPSGGDVPMIDGHPDEAALEEAGAFELEAFGPDQACNATYELEPGTYTLFCIVPIDDEHTHYDEGMRATLVVT